MGTYYFTNYYFTHPFFLHVQTISILSDPLYSLPPFLLYIHYNNEIVMGSYSCSTHCALLYYTIRKLKFYRNYWLIHSIYDYFALLKAFNTNTRNFHQYFKDKLSSHQQSHMHNTRHGTNSNLNTSLFNHSKSAKCYLCQVILIWNSLPKLLKNCTSKFTFKKQIKSHLLASQS